MEKNQDIQSKADIDPSSPSKKDVSALKVFVRVRPFLKREAQEDFSTPVVEINDPESVKVITTVNVNQSTDTTKRESYTFERCFNGFRLQTMAFETENLQTSAENNIFLHRTDQPLVYAYVGLPVLRNVLDGYNGCILAYGQTGSGKTFTMMGPPSLYSDSGAKGSNQRLGSLSSEVAVGVEGIIPRLIRDLFEQLHHKHMQDDSHSFKLELEYYEIYNEKVLDLLSSTSDDPLRIRQHTERGVYVEGLTRKRVTSEKDLFKWLKRGNLERHTGCTLMNDRSSRSHAILTLHLTQVQLPQTSADTPDMGTSVITSKLNLVDLAGSERAAASGAVGLQLQEANKINQSLTALGRVIDALADISQGRTDVFCPYRDSTLTLLLKDSLGGNSKTTMVATVSPHHLNFDETTQTLRYASRAKQIVTRVSVNEDPQITCIRLLTEKVKRLQASLSGDKSRDQYLEDLTARIDFLESQLAEKELVISQLTAELHSTKQENSSSPPFSPLHSKGQEETPPSKKTAHNLPENAATTAISSKVEKSDLKADSPKFTGLMSALRHELKESKKNEKELLNELQQYRKTKKEQIVRAVAVAKDEWMDEHASFLKDYQEMKANYGEMELKLHRLEQKYKASTHEDQNKKVMEAISGVKLDLNHQSTTTSLTKKTVQILRSANLLALKKTTLDGGDLVTAVNALAAGMEAAKEANTNLLNFYASVAREQLEGVEDRQWSDLYAASRTIVTIKKVARKKSRSASKSFSRGLQEVSTRDRNPPPPPLAFTKADGKKGVSHRTSVSLKGPLSWGQRTTRESSLSNNNSFSATHEENKVQESPRPKKLSSSRSVCPLPSGRKNSSHDVSSGLDQKQSFVDPNTSFSPRSENSARGRKEKESKKRQASTHASRHGKEEDGKERDRGEKGKKMTKEKSTSGRRGGSASYSRHASIPKDEAAPSTLSTNETKGKKKLKTPSIHTGGVSGVSKSFPASPRSAPSANSATAPIPLAPSIRNDPLLKENEISPLFDFEVENEKLKAELVSVTEKANRSETRIRVLNQIIEARDRIYEEVNRIGVNPACVTDTIVGIESAARKEWEKEEALRRGVIFQQVSLYKRYVPLVESITLEKEKLSQSLQEAFAKSDLLAREVREAQEDNQKLMQANQLVASKNKYLKQQIQGEKAKWEKYEEEMKNKTAALEKERKEAQEKFSHAASSESEKITVLQTLIPQVQSTFDAKEIELLSDIEKEKKECVLWASRAKEAESRIESHQIQINSLETEIQRQNSEVNYLRQQVALIGDESETAKASLERQIKNFEAAAFTSEEKLKSEMANFSQEKEAACKHQQLLEEKMQAAEKEFKEREKIMKKELADSASLHEQVLHRIQEERKKVEFDAFQLQTELRKQLEEAERLHEIEKGKQKELEKKIENVDSSLEYERQEKHEIKQNLTQLQEELQHTREDYRNAQTTIDGLAKQEKMLQEECNSLQKVAEKEKKEVSELVNERLKAVEKIEEQKLALLKYEKQTEMLSTRLEESEKRVQELNANLEEMQKEHARKLKQSATTLEIAKSEWIFEKERYEAAVEGFTERIKKQEKELETTLKEKEDELMLLREAQDKVLEQCVVLKDEKISAEEVLLRKVDLLDAHKKMVDQRNTHLQNTIAGLQVELHGKEAEIQELKDLNFMQNHLDRVEEQSNYSGTEGLPTGRMASLTKLSTLIQEKIFRYRNKDSRASTDLDSPMNNSSFFLDGLQPSDSNAASTSSSGGQVSSIHEMLSAKVDCSSVLRKSSKLPLLHPGKEIMSPLRCPTPGTGSSPIPGKYSETPQMPNSIDRYERLKPRLSPPPTVSRGH